MPNPPATAKPGASKPPPSTGLPSNIVFYCKDCHKIGGVKRVGRQYVYTCSECGTKNVAFGTHQSISKFFRVKEEEPAPENEADSSMPEEDESEEVEERAEKEVKD